ncbi:LOW QUALITY PROTEIN: FA_desaturase domain-containing protein/DUF3474 domain-containing protein, partial [Cephalotus follicularis]
NGVSDQQEEDFDSSAPPPFLLGEIRAATPKHCWVKNPWSLSYVLRDVSVVFALAAAAVYFDNWMVWPLYWTAEATMFWAIFVLGHDCGHGSFSDSTVLNSIVGHILHFSNLVPYNGWRISHRTHHQNHGNAEKDESWVPVRGYMIFEVFSSNYFVNYTPITFQWYRSPGKEGSHFNPYSDLFAPNERKAVWTSTVCWIFVVALLVYSSFVFGPIQMIKLYAFPHLVLFIMWLDCVTYLHHHGYEKKLPWYRGKERSYLRGWLTTIDRDYGWFNNIHHDIGTHVIHHLFPQIPHYHLVEATMRAKPVIGKDYREPKTSGPFPFLLFKILARSIGQDHYVFGDVVYYQTDPEVYKTMKK